MVGVVVVVWVFLGKSAALRTLARFVLGWRGDRDRGGLMVVCGLGLGLGGGRVAGWQLFWLGW